jgi:pimeloyl-ACP methyl ester carboxylesterase
LTTRNIRIARRLRYVAFLRRRIGRLPWFELDTNGSTATLVVAFGGMRLELGGMPPFEFLKMSRMLDARGLFVRDVLQAWYHRGLPGHGHDIVAARDAIGRLLEDLAPDRTIAVGVSAGGYAALLFGTTLRFDRVIAFAPQTTLRQVDLAQIGDRRWDDHLRPLRRHKLLNERWTDLREVLSNDGATACDVHYDATFSVDARHAERLDGLPNMTLKPHYGGGHAVARALRESGELHELLRDAL